MRTIILSLMLLGVVGCNKNDDNDNFQSTEITPIEIGKSSLEGNGFEGIAQSNLVITNTNDWQSLMGQIDSYNIVTDEFSETTIDFSTYLVLAVFDDIKPHSNFSLEIENIVEEENTVTVNYTHLSGENGFTVIIQPFVIVKIPITNKEIIFESND